MTKQSGRRIAALVLAAGSSRRLGQPKQLLPYGSSTLLGATLDNVRQFDVAQRILTLGGASAEVRESTDLAGFDIVESLHHSKGCSSSVVSALPAISADVEGLFLFLGDQPHIPIDAFEALQKASKLAPIAVAGYRNGRGHPFWFARSMFDELANLHGDKAVWKLLESGRWPIEVATVDDDVPVDVDTWDDYEKLIAAAQDRETT